jgi:predicted dehydrogenase
MPEAVKIAIVGVGNMGSAHIKFLSEIPQAKLVAICDTDLEKGQKAAKDAECAFFANYEALLQARICDAILIATPHYDHTTIGIAALKAGYHVLVEKPISVHKADCLKLIAAYTNPKQVFGAMFNQRTDPHYKKAKQLISGGELGELQRVNWIVTNWYRTQHYYNSGGWRATWGGEGGGVLLNQCPHNLDLLQWLCGMPQKVTAVGAIGKYHDIEVEDDITAILEYSNGATGVFVTSTGQAPGTNRLEIVGTQGKLVIEAGKGLVFTRNEIPTHIHLKTSKASFEAPPIWNIDIPVNGTGGQHKEILQNFVDVIQGKAELIAPAVEGINSVELGNAMLYSALHQQPVQLPLNEVQYETFLKDKIKNSKFVKKVAPVAKSNENFSSSFGK